MVDIGFMGYARSGKDTAGQHLVQAHGYRRVSFADPVRESLLALDPIVRATWEPCGEEPEIVQADYFRVSALVSARVNTYRLSEVVDAIGWEHAKDVVPEVRTLLQRHGTDAMRGVMGDDVWVNLAARKVVDARRAGKAVVVTDCRFPNEVKALREWGFRLVWVDRPDVEPVNGHVSEVGVSPHDATTILLNNSSKVVLRERLDALVR